MFDLLTIHKLHVKSRSLKLYLIALSDGILKQLTTIPYKSHSMMNW